MRTLSFIGMKLGVSLVQTSTFKAGNSEIQNDINESTRAHLLIHHQVGVTSQHSCPQVFMLTQFSYEEIDCIL